MSLFKRRTSAPRQWRGFALATLLLFVAGVALSSAAANASTPATTAQYLVIGPQTLADRDAVARTGAAIDEVDDGRLYVTATATEAAAIQQLGFSLQAQPAPLADLNATPDDFPPGDRGYHTYAEMVAEINAVEGAYPGLVKSSVIGTSYEGRNIYAIKISDNVAVDEDEPEVLFDAHLHAREHITVEMALYLLNLFTGQYATDARIANLVNTREIWILPDLNPDGGQYDISTGQYLNWRKNRQPNSGTTFIGTDLNRNFGYQWACCGGSSSDPASDTYHGPMAFSAPETTVFRSFVLSRRVNGVQQIKASIDFHSYEEWVLWPYAYTKASTTSNLSLDQATTFQTIGQQLANTNGYKPEQASQLYVADGDLMDWMWGDQQIWSYTFEMYPTTLADGGFYPPDEVIPAQTARNKDAVLLLSEYADCPYRAIGKQDQYCSSVVTVPNLIGEPNVAAPGILQSAGLVLGTTTNKADNSLCNNVGNVIAQNPVAGTQLLRGSKVNITVAVPPTSGCA
jgi:carboxypeptidase T